MVKVCVIGKGGREDVFGWKLAQSDLVSEVLHAPGNGGTEEGKRRNVSFDLTKAANFPAFFNFVETEGINMILVGPEAPLDAGIVNFFNERGYNRIFGPTREATALEGDKFLSYDIMAMDSLRIPQAESIKCVGIGAVRAAIGTLAHDRGVVLKARGLEEGKGVIVYDSADEAYKDAERFLKAFGREKGEALVARRLFGQEFSVFASSDGWNVSPLEMSIQDHKRQLDGDRGPNTGGMGAYGSAKIAPREVVLKVVREIMTPVIQEMARRGTPYMGFLYAGMMATEEGLRVIEFNARFGDPEAQVLFPKMKSDLFQHISRKLDRAPTLEDVQFEEGSACCVVLASQGYPGAYNKGLPISGLNDVAGMQGVKVFHAGTKKDAAGRIVTDGGRVLGVTAYPRAGLREVVDLAYSAVKRITIPGGFQYRTDIALKGL